ncbi:MAG TPA: hypothetical protein VK633_07620 [Verrucomicrobiae bacterium]|nr:hypothetical protein [Verrucomicrobiae bacterium]
MSRNAPTLLLFTICAISLFVVTAASRAVDPAKTILLPEIPRSRVVIIQNSEATELFETVPEKVRAMVNHGMTNFMGEKSVSASWLKLVSTGDVVGIKVCSAPGPKIGTRPAVVAGVVEGLLAAKIPAKQIFIWDKYLSDLKRSGFAELAARYSVRLAGSAESGYDDKTFYESQIIGQLIWGDLEFGRRGEGVGKKSYVSKLITRQLTKIINITPLLNHNRAGVAGNLYTLAHDSVDNFVRFENEPRFLSEAVPEIYALPSLGDRVVLTIVDALICQYEGEELSRLHYSNVLNELRLSTDPVALDILSLRELEAQRKAFGMDLSHTNGLAIYSNAALLDLGNNDLTRVRVEHIR